MKKRRELTTVARLEPTRGPIRTLNRVVRSRGPHECVGPVVVTLLRRCSTSLKTPTPGRNMRDDTLDFVLRLLRALHDDLARRQRPVRQAFGTCETRGKWRDSREYTKLGKTRVGYAFFSLERTRRIRVRTPK